MSIEKLYVLCVKRLFDLLKNRENSNVNFTQSKTEYLQNKFFYLLALSSCFLLFKSRTHGIMTMNKIM